MSGPQSRDVTGDGVLPCSAMTRYVALLRGVSPMNCKMDALTRAFTAAGFSDVATVLSSGNVVFTTSSQSTSEIGAMADKAMAEHLGRTFETTYRTIDELQGLLDRDPLAGFDVPEGSKRVVSFLYEPVDPALAETLPVTVDDATIWQAAGTEALVSYLPRPGDPAFMRLIEKTFGKNVTTRTWDTVTKIVARSSKHGA